MVNERNGILQALQTWSCDWRERILAQVAGLGHGCVTEFMRENPTDTYAELRERLGRDVAVVQLMILQAEEALRCNELLGLAKDSVVRFVREHLRKGWGVGIRCEYRTAAAFAHWSTFLLLDAKVPREKAKRTWDALVSLQPPRGWLPSGPDDAYIGSAFKVGW